MTTYPADGERPTPPTFQQVEAFGYQRFTNREQSRLDFGSRLLDLAEDDSVPLLERATDPVATNPSAALEAVATERGWRFLRLFE